MRCQIRDVMVIPPERGIWYQLTFYPVPIPLAYFMLFTYSGAQPLFSFGERMLHFVLDYILPVIINYCLVSSILFVYKTKRSKKDAKKHMVKKPFL